MKIDARHMDCLLPNQAVRRQTDSEVEIGRCLGQRFVGTGLTNKTLLINGVPGNALRAYLDGGRIVVRSGHIPENLPDQVAASDLTPGELEEIMPASTAAARSLASIRKACSPTASMP